MAAFNYSACTYTEIPPDCSQATPVDYTFTYTIASADQGATLYFQMIPLGDVKSTTQWSVSVNVPCGSSDLSELCVETLTKGYTSTTTTSSSGLAATSPMVTWVDAVTTTTYPSSSVATFTVSCSAGNNALGSFAYALWQGGMDLQWSQVGVNTAGPASYLGVPCCGAVSAEWSLDGVATQHQALQATLTVVQGAWTSATMHNAVPYSIDDTEGFPGTGLSGSISQPRTCLSNQSCSTVADEYYISAVTTPGNMALEGSWVMLTLDLIAGAGTVSASVATLAAIAIACLF